ncbi:hypothetical protein [Wolbachia endosymbiont (group B) of Gerris lacustris]|uniref:hypothetical protein n=1 Tax=Wolbachia endosymbiont (group B) of Gerris lacustris TaxID=3066159 RepID=UPI00333E520E
MTETKIEKRSISFDSAKSKFSNDRFQIDSSSNESIDAIDKKFKYEVKLPGIIHTTTRKNNVGDGLNELNTRKKANFIAPELSIAKKKVTFANPEYHIIPNVDNHKKSSPVQATVEDMLFGGVSDSTPCLTPKRTTENMLFVGGVNDSTPCLTPEKSQATTTDELETVKFLKTLSKAEKENFSFSAKQHNQKVKDSKKTYNPLDWNPIYQDKKRFSPDRLNVHPLLHNNAEMHGNITSGTRPYSVTEKCMVTHDGSELGAKMERKHGFQQDLNVKHTKADTVVCSITKGNDKKDVRPDEQEPLSEVSKVNVKELVNRFRG